MGKCSPILWEHQPLSGKFFGKQNFRKTLLAAWKENRSGGGFFIFIVYLVPFITLERIDQNTWDWTRLQDILLYIMKIASIKGCRLAKALSRLSKET